MLRSDLLVLPEWVPHVLNIAKIFQRYPKIDSFTYQAWVYHDYCTPVPGLFLLSVRYAGFIGPVTCLKFLSDYWQAGESLMLEFGCCFNGFIPTQLFVCGIYVRCTDPNFPAKFPLVADEMTKCPPVPPGWFWSNDNLVGALICSGLW